MSADIAIRAAGLGKCYRIYDRPQDRLFQSMWRGKRACFREFWALHGISVEIGRGEAVGVIGRNGSGKSTLLQLISGTLSPTEGEIEVKGRVSALLELGSGFNPEFTGRENVFVNGAILGMDRDELAARLPAILDFADIGEFIDQPVKTYSSGMTVRLAFAVSVCTDPEILIVDEALAVGDVGFQFKCLERLRTLIAAGTTLLFVSHDLALVKTYCSRAIYLKQGRVEYSGSADEAAELYLQDMRSEQRKALSSDPSSQVVRKQALGPEGVAFGTELGRILDVRFAESQGRREMFDYGAQVRISAWVEYGPEVKSPGLAIAIADRRHVVVAGKFSPPLPAADAGWVRMRVDFEFRARLAEGHYMITAVLEDRVTEMQGLLVDKQAGALVLDMVRARDDQAFLGIFDLGVEVSAQRDDAAP